MAEAFFEEIYKDAFVLQLLHECVDDIYASNHVSAKEKYNEAASVIESMVARLYSAGNEAAKKLEDAAVEIVQNWRNEAFVTGMINARLIPLVYEFMSEFTGIDIDDGYYTIESSRSGFLTLKDNSSDLYIHDTDDPMYEAYRTAERIYKPETARYLIFGCGLGYLPYALWRRSGGSVSFVIYEDLEDVLGYARQFGVLDRIPESCLEIVNIGDKERLLERFARDYDKRGRYDDVIITKWKDRQFAGTNNGSLSNLFEILTFNRYSNDMLVTNIRMNLGMERISFDVLKERLRAEEWVVVAAGPSLDDNLEFLRESIGKRRVVCVNTAIKRLANENIRPDVATVADPNERLVKHIEGVQDFSRGIPLIADEATSWKYTSAYLGEKCFVPTPAGKDVSISNPDNMEIWDVMGTVTSLALEAAIRLGAKKIYLLGLDLGYPGGQNYAKGMPHETMSDKRGAMKVKSVDGSMIETSAAFNLFRIGIEQKIADNADVDFINMSKHGAYIEGAKAYE